MKTKQNVFPQSDIDKLMVDILEIDILGPLAKIMSNDQLKIF